MRYDKIEIVAGFKILLTFVYVALDLICEINNWLEKYTFCILISIWNIQYYSMRKTVKQFVKFYVNVILQFSISRNLVSFRFSVY